MNIRQFAAALITRIEAERPSGVVRNEAAFERDHITGPAWELSRSNPEIRVFTHPANRRVKCKPTCDAGASDFAHRVEGCPACWAHSKARSVVDTFGVRNNFDLAAIDRGNGSLAVEVKWLALSATKGPNSEFQRFIGQCTLAAAGNDVVIGVCGLRGRRNKQFDAHEGELKKKLAAMGVHLVVLKAAPEAGHAG
jgi:hypothetical protein